MMRLAFQLGISVLVSRPFREYRGRTIGIAESKHFYYTGHVYIHHSRNFRYVKENLCELSLF